MSDDDPMQTRHDGDRGGGRFVLERDGQRVAEMTYALDGARRAVIDHTWVLPAMRGQGLALRLVRDAARWARDEGVRVVPVCSYARAVFRRHPDLADVLD